MIESIERITVQKRSLRRRIRARGENVHERSYEEFVPERRIEAKVPAIATGTIIDAHERSSGIAGGARAEIPTPSTLVRAVKRPETRPHEVDHS